MFKFVSDDMPSFFSDEVMADAIAEYGCNCNSCCAALMVNRALDKKNKKEEQKYLSVEYLDEFCE